MIQKEKKQSMPIVPVVSGSNINQYPVKNRANKMYTTHPAVQNRVYWQKTRIWLFNLI
jgi:hypothetical protein